MAVRRRQRPTFEVGWVYINAGGAAAEVNIDLGFFISKFQTLTPSKAKKFVATWFNAAQSFY